MRISDWSSDVCSSDLDRRGERIALVVNRRRRGEYRRRGRGGARRLLGGQQFDHRFLPGVSGIVIVDVAIDTVAEPGGAELLQPFIETLSILAIKFIGGAAERQPADAEPAQLRRPLAFDTFAEAAGSEA